MKKYNLVVLANDVIVGQFENREDVELGIVEHMEQHQSTDFRFSVWKVTDALTSSHIQVRSKQLIDMGDECEGVTNEWEYEVHDTGRKFDDMDELKDYMKELVESGEYELDEVRNMDISQTMVNDITFEDASVEYEYHVDISELAWRDLEAGSHKQDVMEENFDTMYNTLHRDPATMSDQEIQEALEAMHMRLADFVSEREKRKGACNLGSVGYIGVRPE